MAPPKHVRAPKRVVIVLNDLSQGGAETQALLLARGLQKRGHVVRALAFGQPKGLAWERFRKTGIAVSFTGFREKLLLPPFHDMRARLRYFRYLIKLILLLRRMEPEVLLPFTYQPNAILGRIWRYTGASACWWNQRDEGRMFLGRPWEIRALENCTGILSNSLEGKKFLTKYTQKSVTLIHNGVSLPEQEYAPVEPEKVKVAMIANLHGYKDHLTLLEAWTRVLNSSNGYTPQLILAGRDGSTAADIRKFVATRRLESSVQCPGLVSDVQGLLADCHIGVFSSRTEGLPNGILECMAMGLPVVATNITGAREALGEDYPWLSEPGDAKEMAGHLLTLIASSKLRDYWGCLNKERIVKFFSVDAMLEAYEKVLK